MIREFKINDLSEIMRIWLEENISAHDFIDKNYWIENEALVKEMMPKAKVFVCENNGAIQGFVGLMDNYIAGIFVEGKSQSRGIGKKLLDVIKQNHSSLSLQVYKKNARAIKFYLKEGFSIIKEQLDENTNEIECIMNWTKQ